MALGNGGGCERREGEVDGHRADFDAAEAIATVAADSVAVVTLLVAIGDAVTAGGVATIGAAAIGHVVVVAPALVALFARIHFSIAAEIGARAINTTATVALIV